MIAAVEHLRDSLRVIGRAALGHLRPGDALGMRQERDLLVRWLGGEVAAEAANPDRLAAAIELYREKRFLADVRQARYACYGCTQAIGAEHYRLIEDKPLFLNLLDYLARQRERTRLFRKCYRGLLAAYCAYDPAAATADGRACHEELRRFLGGNAVYLDAAGPAPAWVDALAAHHRLLDADFLDAYGFAALRGDWEPFDDMRARLEIGDDSWLMRELVFAQVEAAIALGDADFDKYVESVLLLLDSHPLHVATALGMLLDRQARCAGAAAGALALGEQAVALWGNPWLAANAHRWQCGQAAREMVAGWLRRHLLHGFFATLAGDTAAGRRRAAFWELYCDDLTGMYFALGKAAFARAPAIFKFRRDARGLVVRLTEAAPPDLHLLILQFERHHVVELNKDGQAAYFYETSQGTPPFYLSKGWLDVGALGVAKVVEGQNLAANAKPLRHQDAGHVPWEGRFARELGATPNAVRNFCRRYRCVRGEVETAGGRDGLHTEQGERLDKTAEAILHGWGYAWSSSRQGYFRPGRAASPA